MLRVPAPPRNYQDSVTIGLVQSIELDQPGALTDHLVNGGDPNLVIHTSGETLLGRAIEKQKLWAVTLLIKHQADVNLEAENGKKPLISAIFGDNIHILDSVLKAGADVNHRTHDGGTGLMGALNTGDLKKVKRLLSFGASLDTALKSATKITAWSLRFPPSDLNIFRFFLKTCVDPRSTDSQGKNALHYAADRGYGGIIRTLINRHHMDPNVEDHNGNTPLHLAAGNGCTEACQTLLRLGASVENINKNGYWAGGMLKRALHPTQMDFEKLTKILVSARQKKMGEHLVNPKGRQHRKKTPKF